MDTIEPRDDDPGPAENRQGAVAEAIADRFEKDFYLAANPDVAAAGVDPLLHYVEHGWREGRNPSRDFDTNAYLAEHPELRLAGANPFHHFLVMGATRTPPDAAKPAASASAEDIALIRPFFDVAYYRLTAGGLLQPNEDPVRHYLEVGAELGLNPEPEFDTRWYLSRYADVRERGVSPFVHFIRHGKKEGRQPNGQRRRSTLRRFSDFQGYLQESVILPVLELEFREEEKRIFATMEAIRKQLCRKAGEPGPRPLISIILPVYNRAHLVREAIESVLAQSYPEFELLVVNDASTDGTLEVLAGISDPRLIVLELTENGGAAAARNAALERARGELIAYLDADNTMHPDFLLGAVGSFRQLPDADAVYFAQLIFEGLAKRPASLRFGAYSKAALENHNYIDVNTLVHKRHLHAAIGGFDVGLRRLADWDFALRLAERARIYSVPAILSYYRAGLPDALTATEDWRSYLGAVRARQRDRALARLRSRSVLARPVAIVIASYQSLAELDACLRSVTEDVGDQDVSVIVVDNASSAEVRAYLRERQVAEPNLRVIQNEVNFGSTHAASQGIEAAPVQADILILNNDARVGVGAIGEMQRHAFASDDISIVVPRQVLPAGEAAAKPHFPDSQADHETDVSLSLHHRNIGHINCFHNGESVDLSFAPFFCVYIKRSAISALGSLDPEFGRHYRSDRVFCNLVREYLGQRIAYCPDAIVYRDQQRATIALNDSDPAEDRMMLHANRWPPDLKAKLGYQTAPWDL